MASIEEIVYQLNELKNDRFVPRNVKSMIDEAIRELQKEDEDLDVKLNTAISILEEVSNDVNIKPFTRTQVWSVVSMIEELQTEQSNM